MANNGNLECRAEWRSSNIQQESGVKNNKTIPGLTDKASLSKKRGFKETIAYVQEQPSWEQLSTCGVADSWSSASPDPTVEFRVGSVFLDPCTFHVYTVKQRIEESCRCSHELQDISACTEHSTAFELLLQSEMRITLSLRGDGASLFYQSNRFKANCLLSDE